jgi:hypothetical protein
LARKRRGKQSPERYVEGMVELIGALANMPRNGGNGNGHTTTAALTDPSANVEKRVDLQADFDKQLRESNEKWQERFDTERQRANDAKADKESGRVDSRFAELSTQALTLVNTVATTAKAASDAVAAAALQQTEALNQIREIVGTLGTTVTSLVAAGGARQATSQENTQANRFDQNRVIQWIGIVISIGILAVSAIYTVKLLTGK